MKTPAIDCPASHPVSPQAALASLLLLLAAILLGAGCASLPPPPPGREASTALKDTGDTGLGKSIAPQLPGESGESIFYPLPLGPEAFVARLGLARAAERSLDVQYYMIHDDATGNALFREMLHAADRGVRVRL